jgi:hypothetical protein
MLAADGTAGHDKVTVRLLTTEVIFAEISATPSGVPLIVVELPVPYLLAPATEMLYSTPFVSAAMEQEFDVEVQVKSPGVAVAV